MPKKRSRRFACRSERKRLQRLKLKKEMAQQFLEQIFDSNEVSTQSNTNKDDSVEMDQVRISCKLCNNLKRNSSGSQIQEPVPGVFSKSNLKENQPVVSKPYSLNSPLVGNPDFSSPIASLVKIEIDNPEMLSCNGNSENICIWSKETPLEYIEVKTEIDESEFTRRELDGEAKIRLQSPMITANATEKDFDSVRLDLVKVEFDEDSCCLFEKGISTLNDKELEVPSRGSEDLSSRKKGGDTTNHEILFSPKPLQTSKITNKQTKEGASCQPRDGTVGGVRNVQIKQSYKSRAIKNDVIPEPFVCKECDRTFSSYVNLMCHCIDDHDMCNVYKCTLCGEEFRKESEYKTHKETHFEYEYMMEFSTCPVCCIEFSKKEDLDRHLVCHTSAVTLSYKNAHGYSVSFDASHICPVCNNIYEASEDLMNHLKNHEKPYKCPECGVAYYYHDLLLSHMRNHLIDKRIECPECKKTFDTTQKFNNHWNYHLKLFKCKECNKEYSARHRYELHLKTHTGEGTPHQCNVCGKCYSTRSSLIIHLKIHDGEKPYRCTQCGKSFSQHHLLKSHIRMHTGENPYECNICGKAYRHRISLKNHIRRHVMKEKMWSDQQQSLKEPVSTTDIKKIDTFEMHQNEKNDCDKEINFHHCTQCGKRFKTAPGLKRHILSHKRVKNVYQCTVCGKISTTNGNLSVHMRIHTGEKPFTCFLCGKSFRQSHLLKHHIAKH